MALSLLLHCQTNRLSVAKPLVENVGWQHIDFLHPQIFAISV